MKVALIGLPGSGKTSLFNALSEKPVDLVPGLPGSAPHVASIRVRDERLEWLREFYSPKKYTPAALVVEDHAGIPPGAAKSDRRGELFSGMRNADSLVLVLNAFSEDPVGELELVSLECLTADHEICLRRLKKLEDEWKNPKLRDKVEREKVVVERLANALDGGQGAHAVDLRPDEEAFVKGFQLLTRKPVILLVNTTEEGGAPAFEPCALHVLHHFEGCASLEADLAALDGEEREMFAAEYGVTEPLKDRFVLACYRGLGLLSFFTVGEDEVKAWTISEGDDAVTASGKIHTDLARGFIRAEVTPYDALRKAGSMRDVKAAGKQRLEGRDYRVADGDILNIRFSV